LAVLAKPFFDIFYCNAFTFSPRQQMNFNAFGDIKENGFGVQKMSEIFIDKSQIYCIKGVYLVIIIFSLIF